MEDLTGRQFGSYQIVAPLGEGGLAAVHKVYQPALGRHGVLKVLPRQPTDALFRVRGRVQFLEPARLAGERPAGHTCCLTPAAVPRTA